LSGFTHKALRHDRCSSPNTVTNSSDPAGQVRKRFGVAVLRVAFCGVTTVQEQPVVPDGGRQGLGCGCREPACSRIGAVGWTAGMWGWNHEWSSRAFQRDRQVQGTEYGCGLVIRATLAELFNARKEHKQPLVWIKACKPEFWIDRSRSSVYYMSYDIGSVQGD
jgi:hypothetical protein